MAKGPEAPTFQQILNQLPQPVRDMAALGPDYKFSDSPAKEIAEMLYKPDELTREAIDAKWKEVVPHPIFRRAEPKAV